MIAIIIIQSIVIWLLLGYYCHKRLDADDKVWIMYLISPLIFLVIFFYCLLITGLRSLFTDIQLGDEL